MILYFVDARREQLTLLLSSLLVSIVSPPPPPPPLNGAEMRKILQVKFENSKMNSVSDFFW